MDHATPTSLKDAEQSVEGPKVKAQPFIPTPATCHRRGHPSQGPHPWRVAQGAGCLPKDAFGPLERDRLFINELAKQPVAELRVAC